MRIDDKTNLVVEVTGKNGLIYFHSMPISRETFKKYYFIMSKTFAKIYSEGINSIAGARVAAMMIEDMAKDNFRSASANWWDGSDGIQNGLMNEIKRLTNVVVQDGGQWKTFPIHIAIAQKLIDEEDWFEAEGEISFFILASAMHNRMDLPGILMGMTAMWGGQTTCSNVTDFAASLPTSTTTNDTRIEVSSLPS